MLDGVLCDDRRATFVGVALQANFKSNQPQSTQSSQRGPSLEVTLRATCAQPRSYTALLRELRELRGLRVSSLRTLRFNKEFR